MQSVRECVEAAIETGVEVLTLFAFSQENWSRPLVEVSSLMGLLEVYVRKEARELREQGVEVRAIGALDRLSPSARRALDDIVSQTRGGSVLRLNLAISYSGRGEIVEAARRLAERAAAGTLAPDDIDEQLFASQLYTADDPDPDLLIRTSGEFRISNFLLWQLAYTELHISPVLWPDFTRERFVAAIRDYQTRERRFGRVAAG
jgi:undecaprenyl diphosphate synthase